MATSARPCSGSAVTAGASTRQTWSPGSVQHQPRQAVDRLVAGDHRAVTVRQEAVPRGRPARSQIRISAPSGPAARPAPRPPPRAPPCDTAIPAPPPLPANPAGACESAPFRPASTVGARDDLPPRSSSERAPRAPSVHSERPAVGVISGDRMDRDRSGGRRGSWSGAARGQAAPLHGAPGGRRHSGPPTGAVAGRRVLRRTLPPSPSAAPPRIAPPDAVGRQPRGCRLRECRVLSPLGLLGHECSGAATGTARPRELGRGGGYWAKPATIRPGPGPPRPAPGSARRARRPRADPAPAGAGHVDAARRGRAAAPARRPRPSAGTPRRRPARSASRSQDSSKLLQRARLSSPYGPTRVRRSAVRCPPTPRPAPRSRASARMYVPEEQTTVTSRSSRPGSPSSATARGRRAR